MAETVRCTNHSLAVTGLSHFKNGCSCCRVAALSELIRRIEAEARSTGDEMRMSLCLDASGQGTAPQMRHSDFSLDVRDLDRARDLLSGSVLKLPAVPQERIVRVSLRNVRRCLAYRSLASVMSAV